MKISDKRLNKALEEVKTLSIERKEKEEKKGYGKLDFMNLIEMGDMWDHLTSQQRKKVVKFVKALK